VTATKADIDRWLEEAKEQKASHLIVAVDTFDWENYPIFAHGKKDCEKKVAAHDNVNMQRVDEVYNMRRSLKKQRAEYRAWHI
jgi:hypothetical protein